MSRYESDDNQLYVEKAQILHLFIQRKKTHMRATFNKVITSNEYNSKTKRI